LGSSAPELEKVLRGDLLLERGHRQQLFGDALPVERGCVVADDLLTETVLQFYSLRKRFSVLCRNVNSSIPRSNPTMASDEFVKKLPKLLPEPVYFMPKSIHNFYGAIKKPQNLGCNTAQS
jgi:hypothetical protein